MSNRGRLMQIRLSLISLMVWSSRSQKHIRNICLHALKESFFLSDHLHKPDDLCFPQDMLLQDMTLRHIFSGKANAKTTVGLLTSFAVGASVHHRASYCSPGGYCCWGGGGINEQNSGSIVTKPTSHPHSVRGRSTLNGREERFTGRPACGWLWRGGEFQERWKEDVGNKETRKREGKVRIYKNLCA